MQLKVKKLDERAILPTRGTEHSAGLDLYALEDAVVRFGETTLVRTGIAVEIPPGHFGMVVVRSGIALKHGIIAQNGAAVVDEDYRGECMVHLTCTHAKVQTDGSVWPRHPDIKAGDRIAQLVLIPYAHADVVEAAELSDTARGVGGFGSTGVK